MKMFELKKMLVRKLRKRGILKFIFSVFLQSQEMDILLSKELQE